MWWLPVWRRMMHGTRFSEFFLSVDFSVESLACCGRGVSWWDYRFDCIDGFIRDLLFELLLI